jgi:hypothetical protein
MYCCMRCELLSELSSFRNAKPQIVGYGFAVSVLCGGVCVVYSFFSSLECLLFLLHPSSLLRIIFETYTIRWT